MHSSPVLESSNHIDVLKIFYLEDLSFCYFRFFFPKHAVTSKPLRLYNFSKDRCQPEVFLN